MTFDEQLKRAFETLTDRVREEIDRQVRAAIDELSVSAQKEADAAAAAAVAAIPPPPPAPVVAVAPAIDIDLRLLDGVRAIDAARSLTDVLDALVAATARDQVGAGVWLARAGGLHHWRSAGLDSADEHIALDAPRAIAEAARHNAPAWDDGFAVPLALSGQVIAVVYAAGHIHHNTSGSAIESHSVEILARHAAKCLEALTAFKTARAMADRAAAPASAEATGGAFDTNGEEHQAAQRYARLLVSEIKLYHEQDVIDGRRDRDLATRLGGEIARARVMYDARVAPHVRERADHFHDELVRTLAGGDASLLEMRT